jgi:hypothetical protein
MVQYGCPAHLLGISHRVVWVYNPGSTMLSLCDGCFTTHAGSVGYLTLDLLGTSARLLIAPAFKPLFFLCCLLRNCNLPTVIMFCLPPQDISVPQSWFSHFYAVGFVCNLAATVLQALHVASIVAEESANMTFLTVRKSNVFGDFCGSCSALSALVLLEFHLLRRLVESVVLMRCDSCSLVKCAAAVALERCCCCCCGGEIALPLVWWCS